MSTDSTSLDLSDFFNNDESEGLRLAEFLRKKRGDGQRPNYVFMNCEMQHMSLEVQLEKLPPSQLEKNFKIKKDYLEKEKPHDANGLTSALKDIQTNKQEDKADETISLNKKAGCSFEVSEVHSDPGLPFQPVSSISPAINQISEIVVNSSQSSTSLKPMSSRPIKCRLASIRKNGGGVSHGDRLRRYSLRQLSKRCSDKRTLLKEFEGTIKNTHFQPFSCSTPLSEPQPNSPTRNESVNGTCCRHIDTLVRTFQVKVDELKKFMESILEDTLKQVQTCEKENTHCSKNKESITNSYVPKQLLNRLNEIKNDKIDQDNLGPSKCVSHTSLLELQNKNQTPLSRIMKTRRNSRFQNLGSAHRLHKSSSHIDNRSNPTDSLVLARESKSRSVGHQEEKYSSIVNSAELEVQNTPQQKNVTIVLPSQRLETPAKQNSIKIISDNPDAFVFVPVSQTFNKICHAETVNNKCAVNDTAKHSEIQLPTSPTQMAQLTSTANDVQCNQSEDNLKLSDILTDDNLTPMAPSSQNIKENSQIFLNQSPSSTNIRAKCLRKRTHSRQELQTDNCNLLSTETNTEYLPQANNSRRMTRKKLILNRAPGIPINGEKFAQELERMSHYEILDLRKRNSLGQVFGISGRQSRHSRKEAIEKQHKLDELIEKELLNRPTQCNDANEDVENLFAVNNFPTEQALLNVPKEPPLIGENSSDRVSFKAANHNELLKKNDKKQQSELLKQYLDVSKNISQKKRRSSFNKSKRLLYIEGYTQSGVTNNSTTDLDENRQSFETGKPYTSCQLSPPKSERHLTSILKIVSPPPPAIQQDLHTINQVEKSSHETRLAEIDIEALPPPPPEFENSLGAIPNIFNNHPTTNITFHSDKTATLMNINHNDDNDNDEQILKNPQQPVPKKCRKRKEDATHLNDLLKISNESQQSSYNKYVLTKNTLRRSKREHMPVKNPLLTFQSLFQKALTRQNRKKQKERKNSKINILNSKIKSPKITKARQKPKQLTTVSKDVYPLIASSSQDVTIMKKKGEKIKESKALQKKIKKPNEIIQSDENLGSSRLILTTPPPVDHSHNVSDELRYGVHATSAQSKITVLRSPKVKPFKVRVARLKSSAHLIGCNSVNTVKYSCISRNSRQDFISWLKNISESQFCIMHNNEIFKEFNLSPACGLSFIDLKSAEYAFYDTEEKAFLGYLRFQPHQKKPRRRSKCFDLHFVIITGDFRITANGKCGQVGVGDMVAIQKFVYYDIENMSDDIGLLMVIKK